MIAGFVLLLSLLLKKKKKERGCNTKREISTRAVKNSRGGQTKGVRMQRERE